VISIVQRWAQQQPTDAAAWAEQFPLGELKLAAFENVVARWGFKDPERAQADRDPTRLTEHNCGFYRQRFAGGLAESAR
jgi:hypothetical protein